MDIFKKKRIRKNVCDYCKAKDNCDRKPKEGYVSACDSVSYFGKQYKFYYPTRCLKYLKKVSIDV